jgi:8-oxo-dGTP diphosphatase
MAYEKQNKLHIVSVVAVIRNPEGKYLLLKRSEREIAYPGMFTFPGGKVEGNDSIEETLEKEVLEEAGLKLKPGKFMIKDKTFIRPDDQTVKSFSYLCDVEEYGPVVIDENDFSEYMWATLEDLKKVPHVGIEDELALADTLFESGVDLSLVHTKSIKVGKI